VGVVLLQLLLDLLLLHFEQIQVEVFANLQVCVILLDLNRVMEEIADIE
jgi:hypothetical protein